MISDTVLSLSTDPKLHLKLENKSLENDNVSLHIQRKVACARRSRSIY
jgi:hypothetical protein